jgi:hypothetical protein
MLKSTGSGSDSAGGVLESTGCASKVSSAGALLRLPCCRYREEKEKQSVPVRFGYLAVAKIVISSRSGFF